MDTNLNGLTGQSLPGGSPSQSSVNLLTESQFKKPILVYLLGVLFLLAPFGNLAFTLKSMDVADWYQPKSLWIWSSYIARRDWIWISLIFFAGVNLLRARRTAWSMAVFTLVVVSVFNFVTAFKSHGVWSISSPLTLISLFCTLSILLIMYFFRYPYLESREDWTGINRRTHVSLAIQIVSHGLQGAWITNISRRGALVQVEGGNVLALKKGDVFQFQFTGETLQEVLSVEDRTLSALVVRAKDGQIGIRFKNINSKQKEYILRLLRK
jgi:hypothetical protein